MPTSLCLRNPSNQNSWLALCLNRRNFHLFPYFEPRSHFNLRGPKTHANIKYSHICLKCTRIAEFPGSERKSGSRKPIDTKFGMGDYVADATQYPKRHVNRYRGVGVKWGLCFFVCLFFSAARGQTAGPILTLSVSKHVILKILHSFVG